jgi:maltose O-acetyltransferase
MTFGSRVTFHGGMVPSELICEGSGLLEVGDETGFNYGVSIQATRLVRIGRRCMFASYVRIADLGRMGPAPVIIGDDVWLAHGAIIEPGVTIGDGSVVSAGAVVTKDVPPNSLAIGNPARCLPLDLLHAKPP